MEAAFFDLDKTVIARASLLALGSKFFQEGLINRRTVVRSLYAQSIYRYLGANERRLKRLENSVLGLTRGWEQSVVTRIVTDALIEIITPLIYQEAIELIHYHQENGRKVYLVSASPEEIVTPLAKFLSVDGAIASRSRIDAAGMYTGELEFYAYGPYKEEAIRSLAETQGIDLSASYAYSDSYTDLPMLEVVGHPVAVNPDRVLARVARERGWVTAEFTQTMKIHQPQIQRTIRTIAIVAAIVSLGGLAPLARNVHKRRTTAMRPT
ncbi:MAG: HAD family hydrolase [Ferrimicrobium sp.]